MPMYALCDCNNFYASAERLFNPALSGKPVVVLSNNDGCVIARSEEAKACGIKMGDAEFLVRDIIKRYNIQVLSSNYVLYGDMSERVMQNLARYMPQLSVYSIDEAFAWVGGINNLQTYMPQVRAAVLQNTGIPVSIGVAPNKTLAKLANKLAKKGSGTMVLATAEEIENAVRHFPVEDLWGIGRQFYKKLEAVGVSTAGQLREMPEMWFKQHMTVQGQRLWQDLWGCPAGSFHEPVKITKIVSVSRSFNTYITDMDILRQAITMYAARTAEKLRRQKLACTALQVFLLTNKHRDDHLQHCPVHTQTLQLPANDTLTIVKLAVSIAGALFMKGIKYRKAGIIAGGLVPADACQLNIFKPADDRGSKASAVLDLINNTYGKGTLRMASEGYNKTWALKHAHLSKCFTTQWHDIIKVK